MDKKNSLAAEVEEKKKLKMSQEDILNSIQLKSIEKDCLVRVFELLCELQEQPSSDDDNKQKRYLMEIEKRANQKKMKIIKNTDKNPKNSHVKVEKRYKEDDDIKNAAGNTSENNNKKIGTKAIRKILKKLEQEVSKDEIQMMIWVNIYINYII